MMDAIKRLLHVGAAAPAKCARATRKEADARFKASLERLQRALSGCAPNTNEKKR